MTIEPRKTCKSVILSVLSRFPEGATSNTIKKEVEKEISSSAVYVHLSVMKKEFTILSLGKTICSCCGCESELYKLNPRRP